MKTLDQWLAWQQQVHRREIDLGLERLRIVWQRLGARRPAPCVITVGGTNGKGSTVALLEAMLTQAGHAVGCYTSPHLLRYNERIRLRGEDVGDQALISVFERIEAARQDTPLTWFEHGTLAALELMADAGLDVAVLEVGLGGRLDAVNLIDADAAIVTSVGIDHVDYLGPDRDSIGREKAGIFRRGRPAIVADPQPPAGLLESARSCGATVLCLGVDFEVVRQDGAWIWQIRDGAGEHARVVLDSRGLGRPGRKQNLAAALMALWCLRDRLGWPGQAGADAAADVEPSGRVQVLPGQPRVIVDVAHNPHASEALAHWLRDNRIAGKTLAVFSAMADKDIAGIAAVMGPHVDHWHVCPLPEAGPRGLDSDAVKHRIGIGWPQAECTSHASVAAALAAACGDAGPDDRVLAFGSFVLAGAVLRERGRPNHPKIAPARP